jgi:hypothetical protein
MLANDGQQHVTLADRLIEMLSEINAEGNAINVHEDRFFAITGNQAVVDTA